MKTEFRKQLNAEVANVDDQLRQVIIELQALASEVPSSRTRAMAVRLRSDELRNRHANLVQSRARWLDIIRTYTSLQEAE